MSTSAIDPELQRKLDQAARLYKRLEFRKRATKTLETRLENLRAEIARLVPAAGLEAAATKGGGKSFYLAAAGGATVRVTQPANKLLGKISEALASEIRKLIGGALFDRLFVTHYTCAKDLRSLSYQFLEKGTARQLIALVEEPSAATVTFTS